MVATTDRARCPPAPPANISVPLLTAVIAANPDELVRLHWRANPPLAFSISARGNRFDPLGPPYSRTNVLYAGTTLPIAIAETIVRWHGQVAPDSTIELSNEAQLRDRQVARFRATRPLTVIDATALGLERLQRAVDRTIALPDNAVAWARRPIPIADDIFQCSAIEYSTTQAWGAWMRTQCPNADGIQWVSRQFNVGLCLVLFDGRCRDDLRQIGASVDLIEPGSVEEQTLDDLLAQIGWTRS